MDEFAAPRQGGAHGFLSNLKPRAPMALLVARAHRAQFGRWPPLLRPRTLNDKINWMKLFGELDLLAVCADKVAVRDYVRARLGDRLRMPAQYFVTERPEDITAENIPQQQFVVKANHDCGSTLICTDRDSFDFEAARRHLAKAVSRDYARVLFEPHYSLIRPRIIVEEYLANADGSPLGDWRIMCCNGVPRFLYVNMYEGGVKSRAYFDRDWRRIHVCQSAPDHVGDLERPAFLDELFDMSERLAKDFDFVRVDYNIVNGQFYFGELTFTPQAGYGVYDPPSVDRLFGDGLRLTRSRYALMRWLLRAGLVGP